MTDATTQLTPQWRQKLEKLVSAQPVMIFIKGTPDAPRCKFSRELIGILRAENVTFGSFDVLANENVRQLLKQLSDWPTYPQVYVKGELLGGLDIVKELQASGELAAQLPQQDSLDAQLQKLIRRSHVMLFMKGSPASPQCGFSQQIVALLRAQDIEFDSFDILQDDEVRQGLKVFSDWPTYPQLYVAGELLGGLDIVKEMASAGELSAHVKAG